MIHCLVPRLPVGDGAPLEVTVSGDAAHHLGAVLRVRVGERILVLDGQGHQAEAGVTAVSRREVSFRLDAPARTLPRTDPSVTLFQCVAKASHMEWLVEKAVELGAEELVPVVSHHCVVRPEVGTRVARWDRIVDAALEQCAGAWRPLVSPVHSWPQALERLAAWNGTVIACALPPGTPPLRDVLAGLDAGRPRRYAIVVGPEGDFAGGELEALRDVGAKFAGLGPTVLRTDTAVVAALACLRLLG